jgi:hypothetical protein
MQKLILIIECDTCSESFDHVAVSTDRDPANWNYLLPTLEFRAENCGWNCESAYYCATCFSDMSTPPIEDAAGSIQASDDDF